jgi:hypothetical protein
VHGEVFLVPFFAASLLVQVALVWIAYRAGAPSPHASHADPFQIWLHGRTIQTGNSTSQSCSLSFPVQVFPRSFMSSLDLTKLVPFDPLHFQFLARSSSYCKPSISAARPRHAHTAIGASNVFLVDLQRDRVQFSYFLAMRAFCGVELDDCSNDFSRID